MKDLPKPDPKAIRLVARLADLPEGLPGIEVPCSRCGETCLQIDAGIESTPVCMLCVTSDEIERSNIPEITKQAILTNIDNGEGETRRPSAPHSR